MVKILDFNCVRNFWQKGTVYMFSLTRNRFFVNHYVVVVQYFCQCMVTLRQPLKNKNLISLNKLLCKTMLKYKNLFSLTSKNSRFLYAGFYCIWWIQRGEKVAIFTQFSMSHRQNHPNFSNWWKRMGKVKTVWQATWWLHCNKEIAVHSKLERGCFIC